MLWRKRFRPFLLLVIAAFFLWPGRFGVARALHHAVTRLQQNGADSNLIAWRPLTWDDFCVDDKQAGLSAETVSFLRFRYASHVEKSSPDDYTATITQITFSGGFDKARSWRRSNVHTAVLLRHEQGHLDLNEIKRRELQATSLNSLPTGHGTTMNAALGDLSERMGQWFRGEVFALKTRQLQYDAETNYGTAQKKQDCWIRQIAKEIAPPAPHSLAADASISPAAVAPPLQAVAPPLQAAGAAGSGRQGQ